MSAEWIAVSNALAEATEKAAAHVVAIHPKRAARPVGDLAPRRNCPPPNTRCGAMKKFM
jgi:hypothetical protein